MILSCPECHTRFAIDAQALRPDGRRVKCGKCDHIWFEAPPAASAAEPLSVTPLEPEEQSPFRAPNLPAITEADQKRTAAAAWALVAVLLAIIAALGWFGRESIARAWPPAEAIYAAIGIHAFPPPGAGFTVDLTAKLVDQRLELAGEVTNITDETRPLPPLYAVLLDGEGNSLRNWTVDVDTTELGPGERVPFATQTEPVPAGMETVSVLFTIPGDNR